MFHFVQGWDALERLFHLFGSFRPTDNNLARGRTKLETKREQRFMFTPSWFCLVARARVTRARYSAAAFPFPLPKPPGPVSVSSLKAADRPEGARPRSL